MKEQAESEIERTDGSEVQDVLTHSKTGLALAAADPVAPPWT